VQNTKTLNDIWLQAMYGDWIVIACHCWPSYIGLVHLGAPATIAVAAAGSLAICCSCRCWFSRHILLLLLLQFPSMHRHMQDVLQSSPSLANKH